MVSKVQTEDLPLGILEVGFSYNTHQDAAATDEKSDNPSQSHMEDGQVNQSTGDTGTMSGTAPGSVPTQTDSLSKQFKDIMDLTRGSFSQVKKAMKKEEEKVYAIKVIPLLNYNKEHLLREVKALAHLEYKFIVRYYTFWWGESVVSRLGDSEEDDSTSDSMEINRNSCVSDKKPEFSLFIQMEFCEMGSLKNWIQNRMTETSKSSNRRQSLLLFKQIISGVKYIHRKGFIHRDLKPGNILLAKNMTVKIGDFGCVTRENGDQPQMRTQNVGTTSYRAPEQEGDRYGCEVDIFPLGLILFELLWKFGSEMEKSKKWNNIRDGDLPAEFEKDYPIEAFQIKKMLSLVANMRPSAKNLMQIFCGRK